MDLNDQDDTHRALQSQIIKPHLILRDTTSELTREERSTMPRVTSPTASQVCATGFLMSDQEVQDMVNNEYVMAGNIGNSSKSSITAY